MRSPCRWLVFGSLLGPAMAQTFAPLARPIHVGNPSAFDTVRRRLVMFGEDGTTWELDGADLLPRTPQNGTPQPTRRTGHTMCYDEARRRVLMFGGFGGSAAAFLNETWVYDGVDWVELTGGPTPSARQRAAMAWDSVRNRAVLWGGFDVLGAFLDDTWEHDGNGWLQRFPATSPNPRLGTMVFDRQRNVAVLVTTPGFAQVAETWEWNSTNWALRASGGNGPGIDGRQTMVFDPLRNRTVLAGAAAVMQEWDGTNWNATTLPPQPFLRLDAASWFDPGCGCVVLAGGMDRVTGEPRADRWQWNGQALTQVHNGGGPWSRSGVMVADPPRGRVVHFGGIDGISLSAETWALANGVWSVVPSLTRPSARLDAAATHDLVRGESLLFGGRDAAGLFGDTWSLGSTGWVARSTIGPSPRTNAAMAADLVRGRILLFGGRGMAPGLGSTTSSDTWEWDGTSWTQRATTSQPSARSNAAMAFHPALGRTLLFGGLTNIGGPLNDTWSWDGTQWTVLTPANEPPPLTSLSMASDLTNNHCTLVGAAGVIQQVWLHDGSTWVQQRSDRILDHLWFPCATGASLDTMTCVRQARTGAAMVSAAAELTLTVGRVATTGAGCGTPASTLQVRSRPRIGATTGLELIANPNRAVLFALDLSSGNTPLGVGCTLWLGAGFVSAFQTSSASGFAEQRLPVPANPGLRGIDLFAQAAVLEPLSSNGLVLTQGLRLTVGD